MSFAPSGGDKHVYLSGFEIDGSSIDNQVSFPFPENHDEHVELSGEGTIQASWRGLSHVSDARYNVYLGSSADALYSIGQDLKDSSVLLQGELCQAIRAESDHSLTTSPRTQFDGHLLLASGHRVGRRDIYWPSLDFPCRSFGFPRG